MREWFFSRGVGSLWVLFLLLPSCSGTPNGPSGGGNEVLRLGRGLRPSISGDYVVWGTRSSGPIVSYDLRTGIQREVASIPESSGASQVAFPSVSGTRVVWMHLETAEGDSLRSGIRLGDVSGSTQLVVSDGLGDFIDRFPRISGRYVTWERRTESGPDVLAYDTETNETIQVAVGPEFDIEPAVDAGRIVFDRVTELTEDGAPAREFIVLFEAATGRIENLSPKKDPELASVDISGELVTWVDQTDETADIVVFDLGTGSLVNVTGGMGSATSPAVSGRWVVWEDLRSGNADIFAYNMDTEEELRLTSHPSHQTRPDISGNRVVWQDQRNGVFEVFMAELK